MTKRVLIIDDDKELCEEMAEILEDEGYSASMAFDGLKGKGLIEKYDYDILLLDLKMSGLNGFDILKSVKNRDTRLKVLVVTGRPLDKRWLGEGTNALEDKEEETLKLADGLISKPFNVEALLVKIKELIGET